MSTIAARIEQAFAEQAGHCRRMGSEFTARLCEAIPAALDQNNAAGRRILEWVGDPAPLADNVALRVAGALHCLARSGRAPELATVYPPNPIPPVERLSAAIRSAFESDSKTIEHYLDSPPQTNEVGRSAVLLAGWLEVAALTQLPLFIRGRFECRPQSDRGPLPVSLWPGELGRSVGATPAQSRVDRTRACRRRAVDYRLPPRLRSKSR